MTDPTYLAYLKSLHMALMPLTQTMDPWRVTPYRHLFEQLPDAFENALTVKVNVPLSWEVKVEQWFGDRARRLDAPEAPSAPDGAPILAPAPPVAQDEKV